MWVEPQGPLSTSISVPLEPARIMCHVTSHRASSPSVLCHMVTLCPCRPHSLPVMSVCTCELSSTPVAP